MTQGKNWNYAPLQQNEVTTADKNGDTDCGVLVDDVDGADDNPELSFNTSKRRLQRSRNDKNCSGILHSRTTLEKILIAILFLLFIILIISFTRRNTESNDNSSCEISSTAFSKNSSNLCISRGCVEIASRLASALDETVNPCEDFYQFACGGWLNKNPLPSGRASWSTFDILWQENEAVLKNILETNLTSDDPSERKAKTFYKSCLDLDGIEEVGTKPLLDLIQKMGGWEILGTWNESDFDFNKTLKLTSFYLYYPFFSFDVATDSKHSNSNVLQIGSASLTAGSRNFYLNKTVTEDKLLSAFLEYMTTVATLLGGNETVSRSRMLDILNLEKKLAQILPPLEDLRDGEKNYNRMNISSLQDVAPAVDWLVIIRSLFLDLTNITLTNDEPVVVASLDYIKSFSKIVFATEKRTIHNYIMWRLVSNFVGSMGRRFHEAYIKLGKVKYGSDLGCIERWRTCVSIVDGVLGKELGKLFVQRRFNNDNKKSAKDLVADIKSAFHQNLDSITWMDTHTKQLASEKVDAVEDLIGFSDKIFNRTYLDEEYALLKIPESASYFDLHINVIEFYTRKNLLDLRKPVSRFEWSMTPPTVNAYYAPTSNIIVFPAGILQPPYYSKHAPMAVNFGALGVVVGHELTHGFDDQGSRYDMEGNLRNWWGNETSNNFRHKTKCMEEQYSEYSLDGFDINGNLTIGENLADNGGIKIAYNAYKNWTKSNTDISLPSLNYTSDQLFLLSFAQIWCSTGTREYTMNQVLTGVHPPNPIRVLGVLSNSELFSRSFNCPTGSRMNPVKKCAVW